MFFHGCLFNSLLIRSWTTLLFEQMVTAGKGIFHMGKFDSATDVMVGCVCHFSYIGYTRKPHNTHAPMTMKLHKNLKI